MLPCYSEDSTDDIHTVDLLIMHTVNYYMHYEQVNCTTVHPTYNRTTLQDEQ